MLSNNYYSFVQIMLSKSMLFWLIVTMAINELNKLQPFAVTLKGQSHKLRMRDFLPLGALTQ